MRHYSPHLRDVATLPWQTEKSFMQIFSWYGGKCKQILTFANKIFHVTVVLLIYFFDQFVAPKIRLSSRTHCSVCQQSTWYSATRTRFWKKSLYLKRYTANRLTDEFSEKSWTKHDVNKLLKSCGTQAQLTEPQNSTTQQLAIFTKENNYAFVCLIFKYFVNA